MESSRNGFFLTGLSTYFQRDGLLKKGTFVSSCRGGGGQVRCSSNSVHGRPTIQQGISVDGRGDANKIILFQPILCLSLHRVRHFSSERPHWNLEEKHGNPVGEQRRQPFTADVASAWQIPCHFFCLPLWRQMPSL